MFVDYILNWARDNGYAAVYGSPEQVNEMLTNVPFADSKDGTAVVMHLVADSETYNGHDRAVVAVYFASLCQFDFNGESLLPEQERMKNIGKALLNDIRTGNVLAYEYPRWQYGYDDYAENVCWVCLRVTLTALAADCVPLPMPEPPTYDMIPLPEVAAEFIKQLSGGQYEGTIRDNILAEVMANDRITVVFTGVSQLPPPSDEVEVYVTLNGVRHHVGTDTVAIITEEAVEQYPQLAPYVGYYGYSTIYSEASEETEFCAVIEFEGVYTSPEVCWEEEVPELDVLNFYMPFGGTITLRRTGSPTVVELEYSTDGGRTWQIWEEIGTDRTLTLPVEGRMWIRNTSETSTGFSLNTTAYYRFYCSNYFIGYGNIGSLMCKNPSNALVQVGSFYSLFMQQPLLGSFIRFPFKSIPTNAFRNLYYFTPISTIITDMEIIETTGSIANWVYNIAYQVDGDFYCPAELTIPTGASGIPSGWTRHDLSELE